MSQSSLPRSGKTPPPAPNSADRDSPTHPNAEHFPNTTNLLRKRRDEANNSRSPEVSPYRGPRAAPDLDPEDMDADNEPEPLDEEVSPDKEDSPDGESSQKKRSNARELAIARAQQRLEDAKRRREALMEERNNQLRVMEQQRQRKVAVQRDMRREAIDRFSQECPKIFGEMEEAGLLAVEEPIEGAANLIQHALVTDPRVCEQCDAETAQREKVCPITNKPHRRRLIVLAEKLLKLIGETHVNLVPRRDAVGESALAVSSQKARRGIAINPQLFVLAYYNAALPPDAADADPALSAAATQLTQVVEQLKKAVKAQRSNDELKPMLLSFAKAWRQYAKLAQEDITPQDREAAIKELIEATIAAAEVTHRQKMALSARTDVAETEKAVAGNELTRYELLLQQRVRALGGEDAVRNLSARLLEAERNPLPESESGQNAQASVGDASDVPPTETVPAEVPLPAPTGRPTRELPRGSGGYASYTSGSETDIARSRPVSGARSAPPSNTTQPAPTENDSREQFRVLEHRARTAHDVRLPLFKKFASTGLFVDEESEMQKQMQAAIDEQVWVQLQSELNSSPPVVSQVPYLIKLLSERLLDALPERLRGRVARELQDVLDWDMLKHRLADPRHLNDLLKYYVSKLIMFGAPAREEPLKQRMGAIGERLLGGTEKLGDVAVDLFKFLFQGVKELRDDLAQYQLTMLSGEIAAKAPDYQRLFTNKCLPPPPQWASTIAWLRWSKTLTLTDAPLRLSATGELLPAETNYLQRIVATGLIALLASANTTAETRWKHFPEETLYFDKKHIFMAANLTQLFTLRLMVGTTAALLLNQRRLGSIAPFLGALDRSIVEWLASQNSETRKPLTLQQLKDSVEDEFDHYLSERRAAGRSSAGTPPITDAERRSIELIIDRLVDTTSIEYQAFEKKVMTVFTSAINTALHQAGGNTPVGAGLVPPPTAADPLRPFASIEPLLNQVQTACDDVVKLVRHHWETYRPYYEALYPLLNTTSVEQPPALGQ